MDDLKAKLAAQEVDLKQKNEDADKLIQVVGVETEKVSREKSVADAEEQKVASIAEVVGRKQRDCETDLAKAEPALVAAQEALNTLNKVKNTTQHIFLQISSSLAVITGHAIIGLGYHQKINNDMAMQGQLLSHSSMHQSAHTTTLCLFVLFI